MIAFFLTLGLVLMKLPSEVAGVGRGLIVVLSLACFWFVTVLRIISTTPRRRVYRSGFQTAIARIRQTPLPFWLLAICIALLIVAVMRASISGALKAGDTLEQSLLWPTVLVAGLALMLIPKRESQPEDALWLIVECSGWFLIANLALVALGFENSASAAQARGAHTEMLGYVGIDSFRHGFPLGSGVNGAGIAGGLGLVLGVLAAFRLFGKRSRNLFAIIMGCAGIAVMLQTDSRAAFLFAVFALLSCLAVPWRWLRLLRWLPLVSPVLPLVILAVSAWLGGAAGANAISRTSGDFATANGRQLIWGSIGLELLHFRPEHVIGFGFLGTAASGVVHSYSSLFGATFDETRLTAHNLLLQNILDVGYIGAFAFLLMTASAFSAAASVEHARIRGMARVVLGGLMFLVLAGSTEASPTIYQPENFFLFILLVCAAFSLPTLDRLSSTATAA